MSISVINVFVYLDGHAKLDAHATLSVSGLGQVKLEHVLSEELRARIAEESMAALRARLGQTLKEGP